ncbi:Inner membrane protein YmfA [Gimesia maris]|jgi:hypothetical protein|uniref:DUF3592 domain-containing protein n=1 Tax=Gimesia maris TaxID=122 RepID=A0A3D3R3E3_9PLAN|nr:DUF3592 domain-containing protein [Gimesia maris]MAC56077.1 hypothetical protein [Gimesia sp.]QDT76625.1 Inner membrane protein YmfA [Gimesia maris]QDU12277.1 Inner membrane protein YmfA [Gimesia maris]HCO23343.1 hypothetical protein [Gimesia maris]|tara:strand:+ start:33084 stop:33569 length:486 start_codon:yes stop_codon:yes gene_type:complete
MNLLEELNKWPFASPKYVCPFMKFFTYFAALLFLFGVVTSVRTYLFISKAVKTQAVIVENLSRDQSYVPKFTFQDQQGQTYEIISSTGYNLPLGRPGDKIEILYDPDNPKRAEENNFRALWALGYYSTLGGFTNFLTFGAFYLYSKRQLNKQAAEIQEEAN